LKRETIEKPNQLPEKRELGKWFNRILDMADIVDYSYPLKGCGVWKGYGWSIRNNAIAIIRELLAETEHVEMYFPFLVPENIFNKEAEFIRGFEDEVYWVTHGGLNELNEKLVIRPTSETPMYCMFAKWIRTHADLPLKVWQVVSVFRYETKTTRPMMRVREVTTFKEAHTAHLTYEEAAKQVEEGIDVYSKFFDALCLPYCVSKRPKFDTFPGADYTYSFDIIFPEGKTLQIGTVHNLGETFSRAFNITCKDTKGEDHYVSQTCYGISERAIASLIQIHGDDHGMVLPPGVAPVQVVIVPIFYKDSMEEVEGFARTVYASLSSHFRVFLDNSNERPARKFYNWELKGVPLRIEIGAREVRKSAVTLVRRDTFDRVEASVDNLKEEIENQLENLEETLRKKAWRHQNANTHSVASFFSMEQEDAVDVLLDDHGEYNGGIVKVPVCGDNVCLEMLSKYVDVLGVPYEKEKEVKGTCICGSPAKQVITVAKMY